MVIDRSAQTKHGRNPGGFEQPGHQRSQGLAHAGTELAHAGEELAHARKGLAHARKELARARKELARARKELAHARKELAHARKELARAGKELAHARRELAHARKELAHARKKLAQHGMHATLFSRKKVESMAKRLNHWSKNGVLHEIPMELANVPLWNANESGHSLYEILMVALMKH